MSDRWIADVRVWPKFDGGSREDALKACGGERHGIEVFAETPEEALRQVRLFQNGLRANPLVWQTPLYSLKRWEP